MMFSKYSKHVKKCIYCNCEITDFQHEVGANCLDEIYDDQVKTLRPLILQRENQYEFEICCKWLFTFNRAKSTKDAKFARNNLCELLQMQLQELDHLALPFTNIENCRRDLVEVLREANFFEQMQCTPRKEPISKLKSKSQPQNVCLNRKSNAVMEGDIPRESKTSNITTEHIQLLSKQKILHNQIKNKQMENNTLSKKLHEYATTNNHYANYYRDMKTIFTPSVISVLLHISSSAEESNLPSNALTLFFKNFPVRDFAKNLRDLENKLFTTISRYFILELDRRSALIASEVSEKYRYNTQNTKQNYRKRLDLITWHQKLYLRILQLNCFSEIREISKPKHQSRSALLKQLQRIEDKYQGKLNQHL